MIIIGWYLERLGNIFLRNTWSLWFWSHFSNIYTENWFHSCDKNNDRIYFICNSGTESIHFIFTKSTTLIRMIKQILRDNFLKENHQCIRFLKHDQVTFGASWNIFRFVLRQWFSLLRRCYVKNLSSAAIEILIRGSNADVAKPAFHGARLRGSHL